MIKRLESRGEIIELEDHIIATFQEHYKNLFGSKASFRTLGYIPDCHFLTQGGADKMAELSKSFSEEENKAAV